MIYKLSAATDQQCGLRWWQWTSEFMFLAYTWTGL